METKRYLFVINDAPYGNERPYNALRHAMNLVKREGVEVKVFLVADAVHCARKDQKTPMGITTSSAWSSHWRNAEKLPLEEPVVMPEVSGQVI